jgi:hypothetical protein
MKSLEELRAAIAEAVMSTDINTGISNIIALIDKIIAEDLIALDEIATIFGAGKSAANMRLHRGIKRGHIPPARANVGNNRIWARWDFEEEIQANPDAVSHHEAEEVS